MKLANRKTYRAESDETVVYIGRPTPLGNPFAIGRHGDRAQVIALYRTWLMEQLRAGGRVRDAFEALRSADVLLCWCSPEPCHGDVLMEVLEASCRCAEEEESRG